MDLPAAVAPDVLVPYGVAEGVDAEVGFPVDALLARMRALENEGRVFNESARYIRHRRVLVDWISEVGEDHKLHASTMHVAVSGAGAAERRARLPWGCVE